MTTFTKLEGDTCICRENGTYKVCDLYSWKGGLFARYGNGYIRLGVAGSTSRAGVALADLTLTLPLFADRIGRLAVENGPGYAPMELRNGDPAYA